MTKSCFKLSEAANTWGTFPRCAELGRAVAYFEIAPTLQLKPQACTNLHIICRNDRDACGFFNTKLVGNPWLRHSSHPERFVLSCLDL